MNNFYKGDYLTLKPNKGKPIIVVSKKISNKAVVRNRLRRQLKELLRQHGIASGIVKVIRHPGEKSFDLFEKDLQQCLSVKR